MNNTGRGKKNALGLDSFDWLIVLSHITVLNHRAHPRVREGKWKIKGRREWRVYIFLWCSTLHISHPALWINKGWMKWRRRSSSHDPSARWASFVSFITSAGLWISLLLGNYNESLISIWKYGKKRPKATSARVIFYAISYTLILAYICPQFMQTIMKEVTVTNWNNRYLK